MRVQEGAHKQKRHTNVQGVREREMEGVGVLGSRG